MPAVVLLAATCGRESDARTGDGDGGSGDYPLEAIREAPAFELETLDGDTLSLASLDSVPVILMNFWASWCGPCREEMPELIRVHERYRDTDLAILGVTVNDRPEDSRSFAREYALEFPSVIGHDAVYDGYKLSPWIPVTLLVSPQRQVVKEWIGPQTEPIFVEGIRQAAPDVGYGKPPAQAENRSGGASQDAQPAVAPTSYPAAL